MAKSPDEIVAEIDRRQNEEDKDLIPRAGRMLKEKLEKDLTGGAYVGSKLNMGNTPIPKGKIKATDNQTGEKYFMNAPVEKAKGGKVSSASKRADGCCIRGKTRA